MTAIILPVPTAEGKNSFHAAFWRQAIARPDAFGDARRNLRACIPSVANRPIEGIELTLFRFPLRRPRCWMPCRRKRRWSPFLRTCRCRRLPPAPRGGWRRRTCCSLFAHSQFTMMTHLGDRPRHLRTEFGFNAITIQPPDSHNCDTGLPDRDRLSEEQFRAGMAAYRTAGYHVLLYTSVEACGQTPEFQSGQVARDHPEWSQRDPKGNPVLVYGQPWLCPSGGARQYALDRAVRITREYKPDGILLDNSEFFFVKDGWTCHCAACQKAFRDYVNKRFGVERTKRFFGAAPEAIEIPSEEGPLFALWLQWRNRVWAEINESFRARLREIDPKIMIVANTQYLFKNACLATDLQYVHEDAVVSESVGLDSWRMSRKMALGSAMAQGRPLWNYIGTFTESDTYTGIKPAEVISPLIIATIAHQARPWIVDGFDDGQTDPKARQAMATLLAWHNAQPSILHEHSLGPDGRIAFPLVPQCSSSCVDSGESGCLACRRCSDGCRAR